MLDVARIAGVSAMTVSRALRPGGPVSQPTRSRVLAAIDKLGYVPDLAAGALSSRRSRMVAVLVPSLMHPTYVEAARGIRETLAGRDLHVFLIEAGADTLHEEREIERMLQRRPEAIVLPSRPHTPRARQLLARSGVPVVEFGPRPVGQIGHFVGMSLDAASLTIIRHLCGRGRRRIAVIHPGPAGDGHASDLARAQIRAIDEAGVGPAIVIPGGRAASAYERGATGLRRLLDVRADADAALFGCDRAAVGALFECARLGIDVPGRLAVVGFGDYDVGRQAWPALTTAGLNPAELGAEIAKTVLTALAATSSGRPIPPFERMLDIHLAARGTA